jgi:23S rRNA (guanosine2251-2'-O)-methyltransferase
MKNQKEKVLILHNIRSSHNVGSIFRTADAFGIEKIYLSGYTPTPTDRFNRVQKSIAKTALGAELTTSWEYQKTIKPIIEKLKKEDFHIVAIEQAKNSIIYTKIPPKKKQAFILGNEVRGISPQTLSLVDTIAEIPMKGMKESLNVSVSAGIVLASVTKN